MAGSARSAMAAKALQTILNIGLLVLATILVIFLVKETFHLAKVLLISTRKIPPIS